MIEYRDGIRHSCVENKIIAVARKNYTSVTKQPGLLAFKKGDCIVVEKKDRGDTFVGSVNGRTGSFFANDVEFYSGTWCASDGALIAWVCIRWSLYNDRTPGVSEACIRWSLIKGFVFGKWMRWICCTVVVQH